MVDEQTKPFFSQIKRLLSKATYHQGSQLQLLMESLVPYFHISDNL